MELTEKAAYIKGLVDGLNLDANDKQTKVIKALVELVNEMAEEISNLEQCYDDVCDQIDAIDEDLSGVEDIIYDEDYDDDMCNCSSCNDLDDDMQYEVTCPTCGTTIGLDEDSLNDGSIVCPCCNEELEFDYDKDELDDEEDDDETPTVEE
ncbi:MAG: CD1247 N-terminal domain-containing protein [Acutalibacteraceae bacterium]